MRRLVAASLALAGAVSIAAAWPLELEVRSWDSSGRTDFNHDASSIDPAYGSPTSELVYEDLESRVLEIEARLHFAKRYSLAGSVGLGGIDGGLLTDDDYVSALGASEFGTTVSGAHRFSRTESEVAEDDLQTLGLELSRRLVGSSPLRKLELYAGYRFWHEAYTAFGVRQLECTAPFELCAPAGFTGFVGERVISNDLDWDSVWVGLEGRLPLGRRVRVSARAAYSPYAHVSSDDVHHLRDDLEQSPSFRARADGDGTELGGRVELALGRRFVLSLGYRSWRLAARDGTLVAYPVDAPPGGMPLEDFRTRRDGLFLALAYRPEGN